MLFVQGCELNGSQGAGYLIGNTHRRLTIMVSGFEAFDLQGAIDALFFVGNWL